MNTDDYGQWVENKILTKGNDRLVENTLGLVGEAGEVAEKIKKLIRDSTRFTTEEIESELGDVLFYLTAIANHLGSSLTDVISNNVSKLDDRENRNVLRGSGDKR
tara:strand:+ start:171 stop:485 length:315 start_codon:yes stop_codon:yes gene_type:complete